MWDRFWTWASPCPLICLDSKNISQICITQELEMRSIGPLQIVQKFKSSIISGRESLMLIKSGEEWMMIIIMGECAWGGLPHSLRVLPQLDQLEQQLLSTKTGIREARCYQKGWMFGKVPNGPLIFGKSCFWGHVDVCGFWYNFTIKYILNLKENLQYNFLDWKWIWKWIGNAPPPGTFPKIIRFGNAWVTFKWSS